VESGGKGMTVLDIVRDYCAKNDYSLFNSDGECACTVDDLAPCDNICSDCHVGYKVDCKSCADKDGCEKRVRFGDEYEFIVVKKYCWKSEGEQA
jgi:predicted amidophosphoribosyltransferase